MTRQGIGALLAGPVLGVVLYFAVPWGSPDSWMLIGLIWGYSVTVSIMVHNGYDPLGALVLAPLVVPILLYEFAIPWPRIIMKSARTTEIPPIVMNGTISLALAVFVWLLMQAFVGRN